MWSPAGLGSLKYHQQQHRRHSGAHYEHPRACSEPASQPVAPLLLPRGPPTLTSAQSRPFVVRLYGGDSPGCRIDRSAGRQEGPRGGGGADGNLQPRPACCPESLLIFSRRRVNPALCSAAAAAAAANRWNANLPVSTRQSLQFRSLARASLKMPGNTHLKGGNRLQ